MDRDFIAEVQRLRAFVVLAVGCKDTADDTLHDYLTDVIAGPGDPPDFVAMLSALHHDLHQRGLLSQHRNRGLTDAQRIIRWRLGPLSEPERGILLLQCAAGTEWRKAAAVPGLDVTDVDETLARARLGVRRGVAIVISPHPEVLAEVKASFAGLGLPWVENAADIQGLRALLLRHQPEVVIADTDHVDAASLAEYLGQPDAKQRVPTVFVTTDPARHHRFPVVVARPFSADQLRAAVLTAIGA